LHVIETGEEESEYTHTSVLCHFKIPADSEDDPIIEELFVMEDLFELLEGIREHFPEKMERHLHLSTVKAGPVKV
jgi:hypothetical protein